MCCHPTHTEPTEPTRVPADELVSRLAFVRRTPDGSDVGLESLILGAIMDRDVAIKCVLDLRRLLETATGKRGRITTLERIERRELRRQAVIKLASTGAGTNRIASELGLTASQVSNVLSELRNDMRALSNGGLIERWNSKGGSHTQSRRDEVSRLSGVLSPPSKEATKEGAWTIMDALTGGRWIDDDGVDWQPLMDPDYVATETPDGQ